MVEIVGAGDCECDWQCACAYDCGCGCGCECECEYRCECECEIECECESECESEVVVGYMIKLLDLSSLRIIESIVICCQLIRSILHVYNHSSTPYFVASNHVLHGLRVPLGFQDPISFVVYCGIFHSDGSVFSVFSIP
jgi:hypothetical protein